MRADANLHAAIDEVMESRGLRERGKQRRKTAILNAAMELFSANGYESTTVAEIARAAEVAPRTVMLHFDTKQDIALAWVSESAARLTQALRDRPASSSTLSVLRAWVLSEDQHPEGCDPELCVRMFAANPELAALRMARMSEAAKEVGAAIAEDLHRDPSDPIVQTITIATSALVMDLATSRPDGSRDAALSVAFEFLEAGLDFLTNTRARAKGNLRRDNTSSLPAPPVRARD
jgi:AcrR family transcriptional regulator